MDYFLSLFVKQTCSRKEKPRHSIYLSQVPRLSICPPLYQKPVTTRSKCVHKLFDKLDKKIAKKNFQLLFLR